MKRELLTPFVVAGLAVAFLFVCAMVVLTRNRPAWVRRKLRIGAALLGLTAIAAGGCDTTTTCYVQIPPGDYDPVIRNRFLVNGYQANQALVPVNLAESATLIVEVEFRSSAVFSYRLEDELGLELERNDLDALDGTFDTPEEELTPITLPTVDPGIYVLTLHTTIATDQSPTSTSTNRFDLEIINE